MDPLPAAASGSVSAVALDSTADAPVASSYHHLDVRKLAGPAPFAMLDPSPCLDGNGPPELLAANLAVQVRESEDCVRHESAVRPAALGRRLRILR